MSTNYGARYYAKLQEVSRAQRVDMLALIKAYVQQRLLYRISVADCGVDFCLKGGLMLAAYNGGDLLRPTDDIDLNGFGLGGIEDVEVAIRAALRTEVEPDGVSFSEDSIKVRKDRGEGIIPGGKVVVEAQFHTARVQINVDVGFGNVITPFATEMEVPTLLADLLPCPRISAYPLETIVAEKLHAIAQHGMENTRVKDYYDLWKIMRSYEFDGGVLSQAVAATFEQQNREVRVTLAGLSDAFAARSERDWRAFLRKTVGKEDVPLVSVVAELREFLVPVLAAAKEGTCPMRWIPDGGWEGASLSFGLSG